MVRMLLFLALGIIVWRIVRIAVRTMQTPGPRPGGGPFASPTPPKRDADLGKIVDAEFEDITDKTPPSPPSKE